MAVPIQMLLECMSVVLGGAAATLQGRPGCLLTLFAQRFLKSPPTLQLRIRPRTLCFSSRQVGGLTFPKSNRRTCSDLSPCSCQSWQCEGDTATGGTTEDTTGDFIRSSKEKHSLVTFKQIARLRQVVFGKISKQLFLTLKRYFVSDFFFYLKS